MPALPPSPADLLAARGAPDPPAAHALREALTLRVAAAARVRDPRVLDALRRVPRHLFVPEAQATGAYGDHPLPIGAEQTISQPTVVAMMTDALALTGAERVLEIGTGSGYQTAILALLCREVFTIERLAALGDAAAARLAALGFEGVHSRIGDGYAGWPEAAPFDRILITAAPPAIPEALVAQLAEGGILVAPIGPEDGRQILIAARKESGGLTVRELGDVSFVPMVAGSGGTPSWT